MDPIVAPWEFPGARFEVMLATTREQLEKCFRLRFKTFCAPDTPGDRVRFPPENYPDGLETDEYDNHALHLLGEMVTAAGRVPVATFRLIKCELGYFMEGKEFGGVTFVLPNTHEGHPVRPETTFEASRWAGHAYTLPDGTRVLVSMLLAEAALALSAAVGRTHWICGIDHVAVKNLRRDGWPMHQVIPGVFEYYNDLSEVCIIPLIGGSKFYCRRTTPVPVAREMPTVRAGK